VLCAIFLFATGSSYAVQRSHTQAALDFAKLQMDFVTSVSHELRTPLSVICSAADNIADGVIEDPDQIARYGAMIRNQTRQVTELVNEVLLFAKTKEGRTPYILRPISVSKIIDAVIQNTSELLGEEGFDLRIDVEESLPDVMGDLPALTQCLQNLVVNAVKYSGHSRWIGVRAGLHDDGRTGIAEVRISVEDRGLGIAQSEITRIFEPFYRSPAACAAQIHGTGLGLPLARSIAEAMGGKLSVASELGCGSIFTVHLPVAIERVHAASA
jgi:signal transduction histidine kinase